MPTDDLHTSSWLVLFSTTMWAKIITILGIAAVVSSQNSPRGDYTYSQQLPRPENNVDDPVSGLCRQVPNQMQVICDRYQGRELYVSELLQENGMTRVEMERLKNLIIRNGNSPVIQQGAFQKFFSISYITITDMSVETIQPGAFKGIHELKHLDLSDNNIRVLPDNLFKDTGLRSLRLNGNAHLTIPTNGPLLEALQLRWLSLSGCGIEHFPGVAFTRTPELTVLDLSHNRLEQLPQVLFENLPISELYLNNNKFKTLGLSVFQKIRGYPRMPNVVTMADNDWNCDCRMGPLIVWLIENRETGQPEQIPIKSRLQKQTKCQMPLEMKDQSWNAITEWSCVA